MFEHFLRSHQVVPPPPPPQSKSDETPGNYINRSSNCFSLVSCFMLMYAVSEGEVREQVEKMKELVEDGKKRVTVMQNIIHSVLETQRKEWGEFLDELSKDGKKTMTELDGMICSQIGTLRDNMRLNVDEIWQELRDELRSKVDEDIKASRQDLNKDVKSVADQLRETYLAVQETIKEAKTHETYLINQNNRRVIRGEDVEGFTERSKCNNWRLRRRLPQRSSQVRRWSWWRQGSSNGRRTTSTILLPSVTCISIISSLFIGLYCV